MQALVQIFRITSFLIAAGSVSYAFGFGEWFAIGFAIFAVLWFIGLFIPD